MFSKASNNGIAEISMTATEHAVAEQFSVVAIAALASKIAGI